MKTVKLENNIVVEIIPNYALPVKTWYGEEFAAQCVEATDEVQQGWVYNPNTQIFSENQPQPPQPTEAETLRADVDYLAIMTGVTL